MAGVAAPLLQARGLTKNFGAIAATDAVDLDLNSGDSVGLIGPNGAGKSTLLALLAGDHRPSAGALTLDGTDITRLPVHARVRSGVARAAQIPQSFDRLTVRENALLPALFGAGLGRSEAEGWIAEVLALVGLTERAGMLAGALGLLDRKRLELAKAVAARPRVLLLDEIAAGLTEPEIEAIMELVLSLREGRAIVWVEHIPFALRGTCDRLMVMDKGAKTHDGAFAEVWENPELQSIYMGVSDDHSASH